MRESCADLTGGGCPSRGTGWRRKARSRSTPRSLGSWRQSCPRFWRRKGGSKSPSDDEDVPKGGKQNTSERRIRIGVGGWTYEPWRGIFYPDGLAQKRELEFASRQLTSIEINGTYYGSQKPESFAKWHDETPDDFVFSVKGPRFATNRRVLAEAGAVDRALLRQRRAWSSATSSARSTGNSCRPRNSTPRISRAFSSCCPSGRGTRDPSRRRSAARQLSRPRFRRARARPWRRDRDRRRLRATRRSPMSPHRSSTPASWGRARATSSAIPPKRSISGRSRPCLGIGRGAGRLGPSTRRETTGRGRLPLCHQRLQGSQSGCGDGDDRAPRLAGPLRPRPIDRHQ